MDSPQFISSGCYPQKGHNWVIQKPGTSMELISVLWWAWIILIRNQLLHFVSLLLLPLPLALSGIGRIGGRLGLTTPTPLFLRPFEGLTTIPCLCCHCQPRDPRVRTGFHVFASLPPQFWHALHCAAPCYCCSVLSVLSVQRTFLCTLSFPVTLYNYYSLLRSMCCSSLFFSVSRKTVLGTIEIH